MTWDSDGASFRLRQGSEEGHTLQSVDITFFDCERRRELWRRAKGISIVEKAYLAFVTCTVWLSTT
jgi:hypothetical protein